MASYGAARQVSPLIRLGRYTALIAGVIYGSSRMKSLTAKEECIQECENKIKTVRDARVKQEKDSLMAAEMAMLANEAGVKSS